jgi:putative spermidine/putrescine transport system permease protein
LIVMLGPAMVIIAGLFGTGLAAGIARSWGGWTEVVANPRVWSGLALSLWIAAAATGLATLIAVPAALMFQRGFRRQRLAFVLFQVNLTVPHLVGALGVLYLFGQSGLVARIAFHAGLIGEPAAFPAMVFDPGAIGIILTYVWKEVPFLGLIALAALQGIEADHAASARTLGARPAQVLRCVTLPLIWPALARGMMIVFAFTFGAYELPALLGQTAPQALPVMAWRAYTDVDLDARPAAMAMALLIAGVSFAVMALYLRMVRR